MSCSINPIIVCKYSSSEKGIEQIGHRWGRYLERMAQPASLVA